MATVTGLTAARMAEIENASVVDGEVRGDGHLWLIHHDGTEIDAGPVQGPAGPVGPAGPSAVASIPGEVKLWPGSALPALATYGRWVWADGAVYVVADHPIAAGHIATAWRTFGGASDPGGANFRVPDMRGLAPVGMDAMPGGARANRMTRAAAITLAAKVGEETHPISVAEMAVHNHGVNEAPHDHDVGVVGAGGVANAGVQGNDNAGITAWITNHVTAEVTGISIQNNGGGAAHENVQPSVFVPYIVRLDG
jgi:microcystin-dependent protein